MNKIICSGLLVMIAGAASASEAKEKLKRLCRRFLIDDFRVPIYRSASPSSGCARNFFPTRVFIAGLILCAQSAIGNRQSEISPPNIVFIYADDWGWGDLSCHGHPWLKTPNIDRLASEGVDFQQFNVLNPVCSPSRVAAMTGRYPSRFGVNDVFGNKTPGPEMPDWLDAKAPTTARFLQAAGYRTAHFGKWHMGDMPDNPTMADYGFDESAVYHGPGPKIPLHEIGDYAARFIEANKDRPFFVDVWLHESHLAHDPTPESMDKWKHLDEQKQIYSAVITDGDNEVGKVLDALEKAGVAQTTLVVFSSDNGPENTGGPDDKGPPGKYRSYYSIGDTGGLRGRKRSLFEGGVRTPLIARWTGHAPAGVKNTTTVLTAVDLLPTFCAAAGVTPPAEALCDGENLLPAFNGEPVARTRPIFWRHDGKAGSADFWPSLAVRDGEWKLVMTYDEKQVELYHIPNDRAESKNRARQYPEIVSRLTEMALEWKASLPETADPACLSKSKSAAGGILPEKKKRAKEKGPEQTSAKPTPDRARAFVRWDVNQDKALTFEEYVANRGDPADFEDNFKKIDKNGDGKLTREEFVK